MDDELLKLKSKKDFLINTQKFYKKVLQDEFSYKTKLNEAKEELNRLLKIMVDQNKKIEYNQQLIINSRNELEYLHTQEVEIIKEQEFLMDYLNYELKKEMINRLKNDKRTIKM